MQRKMVPKCELLKSIPLHIQELKCEKGVCELEDYVGEEASSLDLLHQKKTWIFKLKELTKKYPRCHHVQLDQNAILDKSI